MTMAYILAVNPGILGVQWTAVLFYSEVSHCLLPYVCIYGKLYPSLPVWTAGSVLVWAYPFVCTRYGLKFCLYRSFTDGLFMEMALTAVFAEGIIFILLSLTNVREKIFNAIPMTLTFCILSVSAGIGLFIAFIGLQNAKDRSRRCYAGRSLFL